MKRVHLIISGDVQGVGFRAWVLRYSRQISCTGWVKNRDDGTVEITAEGPRGELEELIAHCQHGPEVAWVERVDVNWSDATSEFHRFEVLY
jgi:acylphosphatase